MMGQPLYNSSNNSLSEQNSTILWISTFFQRSWIQPYSHNAKMALQQEIQKVDKCTTENENVESDQIAQ